MAAGKKRKTFEDNGEDIKNNDVLGSKPAKKPTKRRNRKKTEQYPMPRENLIMELPGELRTQIYELVLPTGQDIEIRPRRRAKDLRRRPTEQAKRRSWREPNLLGVSKQIRAECSSRYYVENRFIVYAKGEDLGNTLEFLRRKSVGNDGGRDITIRYNVRLVKASWYDVKHWQNLAVIAFHTDGNAGQEHDSMIEAYSTTYCLVATTVQEPVALGRKARQRGHQSEELREDFKDWAVGKITMLRMIGQYNRENAAGDVVELGQIHNLLDSPLP